VKYYLLVYNGLSAVAWSYVLLVTLIHVFNLDRRNPRITSAPQTASSTLARLISSLPFIRSSPYAPLITIKSRIPPYLQPLYSRATTTYARVGTQTAFVQSVAVLEVLHVLLGLIRSPLQTTLMQVSSRLFLVWGITEQFEIVSILFHSTHYSAVDRS
jgi:very-long-chain (3R)-3-hydroxyacyl-CoA dehydratase